jgi:hypothetical protein
MGRAAKILHRYARRPWRSLGWIVVLFYAIGFARMTLTYRVVPNVYVYASIYFVLLAVAGLIWQWGPTVMFTLGGFCAPMYLRLFSPAVSGYRTWLEVVMEGVGYPALVAVFGLVFGASLELARRTHKTSEIAELTERLHDV